MNATKNAEWATKSTLKAQRAAICTPGAFETWMKP